VLAKEKRLLKERLVKAHPQGALVNVKQLRESLTGGELGHRVGLINSESEIDECVLMQPPCNVSRTSLGCVAARVEKQMQGHWLRSTALLRFLSSLFYLLLSHTELLCYFMIVLNQMASSSIISLPLPILLFFWGTLCSPRPPQRFWVTVIVYTMVTPLPTRLCGPFESTHFQAMVVVKSVCQLPFMPDTSHVPTNLPFSLPRIFGVERRANFAAWDVSLLLLLFFHRHVLMVACCFPTDTTRSTSHHVQSLGLWKKSDERQLSAERVPPTEGTAGERAVFLLVRVHWQFVGSDAPPRPASFIGRLLHPACRYIKDLYAPMFLCDFVCCLILVFGYSSFGVSARFAPRLGVEARWRRVSQVSSGDGDVVSDIRANRVSFAFVVMLIALMLLVVVDRAIYLRKSVWAKLLLQIALVTAVHAWLFFALPALTDRCASRAPPHSSRSYAAPGPRSSTCPPSCGTLSRPSTSCCRPGRSATATRRAPSATCSPSTSTWPASSSTMREPHQIGSTRLLAPNRVPPPRSFVEFPLLLELRTLIDWIWTDTCMSLLDYFNMENVYSIVYKLKAWRRYERRFPTPKGEPRSVWLKYGVGGTVLLLVILLVCLPLLMYALVNAIGERALPDEARLTVRLGDLPVGPVQSPNAPSRPSPL